MSNTTSSPNSPVAASPDRTITNIVIANRGEIARRIIRTASKMGIRTIAVYVPADADAPFVAEADCAYGLVATQAGTAQAESAQAGTAQADSAQADTARAASYLDGDAIIAAATAAQQRFGGSTAIHPGYGFLSENAQFARAVIGTGLIWVGPSPEVIEAMGDKVRAKQAAIDASVPTLPFTENPDDAHTIGFPLLIKAAAGGGGKGMRVVTEPNELTDAIAAAKREALNGFGDDRVFFERYVPRSRHIEIQVFGDAHGNVVHLGERECSIQRRHQKIVEESPSTALTAELRQNMADAAIRLTASLGYQSAGTVEFLFDDDANEFFFLEVNTRLQVEHPVTEMVTGHDLVRLQLEIAEGARIDPNTWSTDPTGHSIEVRLYAEDATAGFLPAIGTVEVWNAPEIDGVRWDSGIETGSVVGLSFDPMLAKIIAHGASRTDAARSLARALDRLQFGGLTTNIEFLASIVRSEAFLSGDTTTDFIDRVDPSPTRTRDAHESFAVKAASALWIQHRNRVEASVLATMPAVWRNTRLPAEYVRIGVGGSVHRVSYARGRDGDFVVSSGDDNGVARILDCDERSIDLQLTIDGESVLHRHRFVVTSSRATAPAQSAKSKTAHDGGERLYLNCGTGTIAVTVAPRFTPPGSDGPSGGFVAPMPGVVLELRVEPGQQVAKGDTLIVLEAMKMEHHISAPDDGVVEQVLVETGQQVANGERLLEFAPTTEGHDRP